MSYSRKCCVQGCNSKYVTRRKDNPTFFYTPIRSCFNRNLYLRDLNNRRKIKWCETLKRDLPSNASICGRHFLTGKPAKLTLFNDPDWVPTLDLDRLGSRKTTKKTTPETSTTPDIGTQTQKLLGLDRLVDETDKDVQQKTTSCPVSELEVDIHNEIEKNDEVLTESSSDAPPFNPAEYVLGEEFFPENDRDVYPPTTAPSPRKPVPAGGRRMMVKGDVDNSINHGYGGRVVGGDNSSKLAIVPTEMYGKLPESAKAMLLLMPQMLRDLAAHDSSGLRLVVAEEIIKPLLSAVNSTDTCTTRRSRGRSDSDSASKSSPMVLFTVGTSLYAMNAFL